MRIEIRGYVNRNVDMRNCSLIRDGTMLCCVALIDLNTPYNMVINTQSEKKLLYPLKKRLIGRFSDVARIGLWIRLRYYERMGVAMAM
jgi:hypothetical protein